MPDNCLIVADIGGTNARFALADAGRPAYRDLLELRCADFASVGDAIRHFLAATGAPSPDGLCFAAAGPVVDDVIEVTNNHWVLSRAELQEQFGVRTVRLLNDFEAIAYSLPFLGPEDRQAIGASGTAPAGPHYDLAVVGPGTGLGVAGLCGREGRPQALIGEGGHIGFAPESDLQVQVLDTLRQRFGRVSAERLLAGSGIENIHAALTGLRGEASAGSSAAEIFAAATNGNATARASALLFFEILGQFAGDVALLLGARDGIYIAGGIARRYPGLLAESPFRDAFERKGRHRRLMERIPTFLVLHEQPGLLGAAYCASLEPGAT